MTSQVLARKWRPRGFDTLVGQEHVVRALSHALDEGRLHHAYLFTGTRGVGKTTLARILAKALNCERGVSSRPCGVCAACTEIDAGRFVDLLEIDAATNTGVDDVRALQDNAAYAPTRGRYKVFVIDEVHMLSKPAFNAMLKTLEEPPEHIKFILATTDPQKIPVTVLSRCLQFNLKNMPQPAIAAHLQRVLEAEGVAAEAGALKLIARAAAGSMRDALSLLDQAIAHGAGRVEEAEVRDMLGTVGADAVLAVLDAVLDADMSAALAHAESMAGRSVSLENALQEMAAVLHRVALAQFAAEAVAADPDGPRLQELARRFDPEYLQLCYQIAVHARNELHLAPDELAGFTMALLRMVAFRPHTPEGGATTGGGGSGTSRLPAAPRREAVSPAGRQGAPVLAPEPVPGAADGVAADAGRAPAARDAGPDLGVSLPAPPPSAPAPAVAAVPIAPQPAVIPSQEAADEAERDATPVPDDAWHVLVRGLHLRGLPRELANHCDLVEMDDSHVRLRLAPVHKPLLAGANQDKLEAALGAALGRPVRLAVELAEPQGQTLAQRLRSEERERRDVAIQAIENDPFVREVIELFDAELNESSIRPV